MHANLNEALQARDHRISTQTCAVRNGAQITIESLLRNGVDTVFGFPGGTVIPLYDEILSYRDQLRHILVRHEQGAVHAAQAYARVTGRPGVAIGTSGPGASNLITGIMDAHLDSTPVVAIAGQVATNLIGINAFQECDMMCMTSTITKHNFQVRDANDLERVINEAFHIATTGRPGPVYIDLPKDVQTQTTRTIRPSAPDLPYYVASRDLALHTLSRAATLIRNARRPLMLIGQGAVLAKAWKPLGSLARELHIPVCTTIMAKGAFDEMDPLSLGCLGMHGRRAANFAVANCDVLIAVGCRFSDRITGDANAFARGKKIIHVDIDPCEIGKNVPAHVEMNCDAKTAANALLKELRGFVGQWSDWTFRIKHFRKVCNRCIEAPNSERLLPRQVMAALNDVLGDEDVVTTGVGQHQMFASHYLYRRKPRTFITSGGAGTMGFGLPAAIGAALAKPWANTWAVDGDGSFQMTVQELGTLANCGAKVIVVLMDNGYLGMVRQWQEMFAERRYSEVELCNNPDFVKLAGAYGIDGRHAPDLSSLKDALAYARSAEKSVLIHVPIEPESNITPMIPPGGKITDFCGYCIGESGAFFTPEETSGEPDCNGPTR
jgi:acetolactate synthase-1/2/3 large subunit